jgi:hypothetical protein
MFALLLLEQQTRKLILRFVPFSGIGAAPGFYINIVLLVLMIVGLALSLLYPTNRPANNETKVAD